MTRQEWLEERKKGIGASEASAVVGMNPYKTNRDLYFEKIGQSTPDDISDKPYVQYGINAEHHLRELFKLDYPQFKVDYNEFLIYTSKEYPFITATLDGELTNLETGERGVLEIKTSNILQSMQRESWNERIPQNYYIQCLAQLLATDFSFVILKANLRTEWGDEVRINTKHYTIRREDVLEDLKYLQGELIKFWDCVQKRKEPALILPPI